MKKKTPRKSRNVKKRLHLLKHNRQTDGQNNVKIICAIN